MLKQRPAGDKSWPIRCRGTTLGTADKELDLSGAHLSYGDFTSDTFIGARTIKLDGAGLRYTNMSGAKLIADGGWGDSFVINLTRANLTNAEYYSIVSLASSPPSPSSSSSPNPSPPTPSSPPPSPSPPVGTTLGTADNELDLSGAHLAYGDFEDATFKGAGTIKPNPSPPTPSSPPPSPSPPVGTTLGTADNELDLSGDLWRYGDFQ